MSDPNILASDWQVDASDTVGMRSTRVGAAAGARDLGAAVFELTPGGAVAPYHAHHGNEELLIVLAGRPRLRTPAGTRDLEPGAVVSFQAGGQSAHRISNPTDKLVRVLLVSTMRYPEVAEYPDTGTTLVLTSAGDGMAFPVGADQPFLELYRAAITADRERDRVQDDAS